MCDKQNINFPKCTEEFSDKKISENIKQISQELTFPILFFLFYFSLSKSIEDYGTIELQGVFPKSSDSRSPS